MNHSSANVKYSRPAVPSTPTFTRAGHPAPLSKLNKPQAGGKDDLCDLPEIPAKYKRLKKELDDQQLRLFQAKHSFAEAAGYMSRMQSLLSQRSAARKAMLRRAKLPSWSTFISEYAAQVGYSVRELTCLIRDHRNTRGARQSRKTYLPGCECVLASLLEWAECCGDRLPVLFVDVCRNADAFRTGKRTLRQWREIEKKLHQRARRAITEHDGARADSPATHSHRYLM